MQAAPTPLKELIRALAFAAGKHRNQRRKGGEEVPYINHPIELVQVLAVEAGVEDLEVLCAAVLHDTLEDTATTEAELLAAFGPEVAAIVLEVSDDKSLSRELRKRRQIEHAPHLRHPSKLVKLADKICNLRDILVAPPAGWEAPRKLEYFDWAAQVVHGLRGAHPGLEALFDQVYARRSEIS